MLVDEQLRKCVTFLFVDRANEQTGALDRIPAATAFFVGMPLEGAVYAVTARHVIDASRPYGPLYVRVNLASGGFQDFVAPQDAWVGHLSTDVAVIPVGLQPEGYDVMAIAFPLLADDHHVAQQQIGVGDDVFFVGLFSEHPGRERNQPIVRFGNISLMPREKIFVRLDPASDTRVPVDAYLVEARSWGGHSGSPAFVYFPPDRKPGEIQLHRGGQIRLLGLVHGHYEIEQEVALIGDILGSGKVPINAGIAIVIPAQKIIEVLMQEELVEQRWKLIEQAERRASAPKPDTAST